jgi:hypothetical protein
VNRLENGEASASTGRRIGPLVEPDSSRLGNTEPIKVLGYSLE